MTGHVAPERIAGYADGELAPDDRASVERHLAACERCRKDLQSLRELDDQVLRAGEAAGRSAGPELPQAMRDELAAAARTLIAAQPPAAAAARGSPGSPGSQGVRMGELGQGPRPAEPGEARLRRLILRVLPAVAAAILIVAVFLWTRGDVGSGNAFDRVEVHGYETPALRGSNEHRFHLEVTPNRKTWLCVLKLDARGRLSWLLPDPNPALGSFGLDGPFMPKSPVRIPPDPLDFAAPAEGQQEFVFLVPSTQKLHAQEQAGLLAELATVLASPERSPADQQGRSAAIAEVLRSRFPGSEARQIP